MSAIFYHDEEQRDLAESTKRQEAQKRGQKVLTRISPAEEFHDAEKYAYNIICGCLTIYSVVLLMLGPTAPKVVEIRRG